MSTRHGFSIPPPATVPPSGERSTLHQALTCLADPLALSAVVLLLLNDHVLKAAAPSWLTGKLSDLAGLYFFPFLILAGLGVLDHALPRRWRSPEGKMRVALLLSALWFVALKATPFSNTRAVALLDAVTGRANQVIADPTDLIALAVLPFTWLRWRALNGLLLAPAPARRSTGHKRNLAALALAALATLATSPDPPPPEPPIAFGSVIDVAADPADGDVFYASLATQRITEWDQEKNAVQAEKSIETYRSQDGGRTWSLYAPVGGYLHADPHTPGQLYALNEEGLSRITNGQAQLLPVPWKYAQLRLFSTSASVRYILPSAHPLALDPVTRGRLYLADGSRILVSTDGGDSWRPLAAGKAPGRVTALAIAPSLPSTLYAAAREARGIAWILRSDDGGDSWTRSTELDATSGLWAMAVHPQTPDVVHAVGYGIFRSADGGRTWQQSGQTATTLWSIALHPTDPSLIYATGHNAYHDTTQTTYRTTMIYSDDGGSTWLPLDPKDWNWSRNVAASPVAPYRVVVALDVEGVAVQEVLTPALTPTPPSGLDPAETPTVVYADAPRYDLRQGWQVFKRGLPVFIEIFQN